MDKLKIKINTNECGAESSALMEELTQVLREQVSEQEVQQTTKTTSVPNTMGIVLSEVLLTFAIEVAKDVTVAVIVRLVEDLIKRFFSPKEAEHVTVTESPNAVVITNNGNDNNYNITINVLDD